MSNASFFIYGIPFSSLFTTILYRKIIYYNFLNHFMEMVTTMLCSSTVVSRNINLKPLTFLLKRKAFNETGTISWYLFWRSDTPTPTTPTLQYVIIQFYCELPTVEVSLPWSSSFTVLRLSALSSVSLLHCYSRPSVQVPISSKNL